MKRVSVATGVNGSDVRVAWISRGVLEVSKSIAGAKYNIPSLHQDEYSVLHLVRSRDNEESRVDYPQIAPIPWYRPTFPPSANLDKSLRVVVVVVVPISNNAKSHTFGQRGPDKRFALLSGGVWTEHDVEDKVRTGECSQGFHDRLVHIGPGRLFVYEQDRGDNELFDGGVL